MKGLGIGLAALLLTAAAPAAAQFRVPPAQMAEPGETGRRVAEEGLIGNYFPAGPNAPALLLLGGSEGALAEGSRGAALALQREGFTVLQLSYFRAPGQNARLENIPLEYFAAALDWLGRQPEADSGRVAIVGGSKGAEAALLVASRRPEVRAVVAAMPSSVAWPGIDWEGPPGEIGSSWSEDGRPVPHLPYGQPAQFTSIADVYVAGMEALPRRPEAVIAVERIGGPVLLICGEADTLWPSCPMARQIEARASEQGRPEVTLLAFEEAGHAVFGRPLPDGDPRMAGLAGLGGTPEGNNAARAEGWARLVAFLKEALGS